MFLAGVLWAFLVFGREALPFLSLALPAGGFLALVLLHDRVIEARRNAERAARFYEQGIARIEGRFAGLGNGGERFVDPDHPYAADLDLFGRGSLFELLSTARTQAGEATLAGWLLAPADPVTVRARQEAVAELRPGVDRREALALLAEDVRSGVDAAALRAWGAEPPVGGRGRLRSAAFAISAGTFALFAAAAFGGGPVPLAAGVVLFGAGLLLQGRLEPVVRAVERPARDLQLFVRLLARIEAETFCAPRLVALQAALRTAGGPPSIEVAALARLVDLLDARRNQLFAPFALLVLWSVHCALAIEGWRERHGQALATWIEVAGEFEALSSLAGYAYEHPADVFPELAAGIASGDPLFAAEALGHPLIAPDVGVTNDLVLGGECRLLLVSGSNMSGKSTLLRTVGINAVLAQAGAPVRARRLTLTPFAVGASIRLHDSLQEGTSRFYAEIRRIGQLMTMASHQPPLLFLLDEILHGTNSHDRRIGAEAIVRGLIAKGAIGLVTTHDLALARVAESLAPAAANVHFEDHLEDGKMTFDYRLRPGVVTRSNALELMRSVGLEV